jgi:hypothetical protein
VYDNVLAQPDQVIEVDVDLANANPLVETITATLTFNGVQQSPVYFNLNTMSGSDPHIHLAQQVDTSALASGRYPWSMTVTSPNMAALATVSGYVNVVNDSSSPFGKGWDMPGLDRLFNNSVSGVPNGCLHPDIRLHHLAWLIRPKFAFFQRSVPAGAQAARDSLILIANLFAITPCLW